MTRRTARFAALITAGAAVTLAYGMSGCNNAAEGGFSGAGLGAGAGAIIGSLYGDAGKGAIIGLVGGALSGAVIGDQNERNSRGYYSSSYASAPAPAYYEPAPRVVYEERYYSHDYSPRDRYYCR